MDSTKTRQRRRPGRVRLLITSIILLVLAVIWALFMAGDFRAFEVVGDSMLPTLTRGDRIIARATSPSTLQRGDIVVVDLPSEGGSELIKRLIAIPGDTIRLQDGVFYVNDEPEPAIPGAPPFASYILIPRTRLGKNAYFVLGDNRPVSYDSEEFGPIPAQDIWGVVICRYYPWGKRGAL